MTREELKGKLRAFIEANFYVDLAGEEVTDDTSLVETGIIDSTGILELVGFVEGEFGITVDDSELVPENFGTINNLTNYLLKKIGAE